MCMATLCAEQREAFVGFARYVLGLAAYGAGFVQERAKSEKGAHWKSQRFWQASIQHWSWHTDFCGALNLGWKVNL